MVGAGNSAGQAALHLSRFARDGTLVVRGETLASNMSNYLRETLAATENISIRLHTEVVDGAGAGRLEELTLRDRGSGEAERLHASSLFIMIGAEPRTDWLPDSASGAEVVLLRLRRTFRPKAERGEFERDIAALYSQGAVPDQVSAGRSLAAPSPERRCSCSKRTTVPPSPTAAATRLIEPCRTSPAANTPGTLVSSVKGSRS